MRMYRVYGTPNNAVIYLILNYDLWTMSLYVTIQYDIHGGQKNVRPQTHGHNSVKPVQNSLEDSLVNLQ